MTTDKPIYADVPQVIGEDEATVQQDAVELQEPHERTYHALPPEAEVRIQSAPWLYSESIRSYALELLDRPDADIMYSIRVVCSDAPNQGEPSVVPDMVVPPAFWAGMKNCNQIVITGTTSAFDHEKKSPMAYRDRVSVALATVAQALLTEENAKQLPIDFDLLSDKPEHINIIGAARAQINRQINAERVSQFIARRCSVDPQETQWLQFIGNTPESLAELTEILEDMVITRFAHMDPGAENFLQKYPDHQYLVCGSLLYYRRDVTENPDTPMFAFEPYGMMIQVMSAPRSSRFAIAPALSTPKESDAPSE